jgi:hypothetical protein
LADFQQGVAGVVAEIKRLHRTIARVRRLIGGITDPVTLAGLSEYVRDLEAQLSRAEQSARAAESGIQPRYTPPDPEV